MKRDTSTLFLEGMGLRELARHLAFSTLPRPWLWPEHLRAYHHTLPIYLRQRRLNLLRSHLSVGLPDENDLNEVMHDNTPHLKTILSALQQKNLSLLPSHATGVRTERAVARVRELAILGDNVSPSLFDASAIDRMCKSAGKPRLLYISHNDPDAPKNGYAVRTRHIIKAFSRAGVDIAVCVRPTPTPANLETKYIGEVPVFYPSVEPDVIHTIADYVAASSMALDRIVEEWDPTILQAASNHLNGISAALSAKKYSLPFVYEVRGLWEVTRLVTHRKYKHSYGYAAQVNLENAVISQADLVFTINDLVKDHLLSRGAKAKKWASLRNCGSTDILPENTSNVRHALFGPNHESCVIFGYAGSGSLYEGLEDLINAFHTISLRNSSARLVIITDNKHQSYISKQLDALGLSQITQVSGAMSSEKALEYVASMDVAVIPRKSYKVSQLVTPLKPFDALSVGTACIFSDVKPLAKIAYESKAAIMYGAGNVKALTASMQNMIDDPVLRHTLAKNALAWVKEERNWDMEIQKNVSLLKELIDSDDQ